MQKIGVRLGIVVTVLVVVVLSGALLSQALGAGDRYRSAVSALVNISAFVVVGTAGIAVAFRLVMAVCKWIFESDLE